METAPVCAGAVFIPEWELIRVEARLGDNAILYLTEVQACLDYGGWW